MTITGLNVRDFCDLLFDAWPKAFEKQGTRDTWHNTYLDAFRGYTPQAIQTAYNITMKTWKGFTPPRPADFLENMPSEGPVTSCPQGLMIRHGDKHVTDLMAEVLEANVTSYNEIRAANHDMGFEHDLKENLRGVLMGQYTWDWHKENKPEVLAARLRPDPHNPEHRAKFGFGDKRVDPILHYLDQARRYPNPPRSEGEDRAAAHRARGILKD